MQDEILKHTEKIYKIAKHSQHPFWARIKEILIEIFIIVFAVSLSIWLHNWSEHRAQQIEVRDFYTDLKSDLARDIQSFSEKKKSLAGTLQSYAQINSLTQSQVDTASHVNLNFQLATLKTNDGNYQGFKSSGKIAYIENKKLKRLILQYYQESLPELYDIEKYHYAKDLETFEIINAFSKPQNKLLTDPAIRAKISLGSVISQSLMVACDQTISQATEILKELEEELKE